MGRPHASSVCFLHCPAVTQITLSSVKFSFQLSELYCFCAEWNVTVLKLFVYCMLPKRFCAFTADIHRLLVPNTQFAVKWIMMFVMDSVCAVKLLFY